MVAIQPSPGSTCAWFDTNYPSAAAFPTTEDGALLCTNTLTSYIKAFDATSGPDPFRDTVQASGVADPVDAISAELLDVWSSLDNVCTDCASRHPLIHDRTHGPYAMIQVDAQPIIGQRLYLARRLDISQNWGPSCSVV